MEKKMKSVEGWKLAGADLIPPENCPDAVTKFTVSGPKTPNSFWRSLLPNVRKHLAFLGWRIEYMSSSDDEDTIQFRYTSPDGDSFLSLRDACRKLKKTPRKMDSVIPKGCPKSFIASRENNSGGVAETGNNLSSCNEESSVPPKTDQSFTDFSARKMRRLAKTSSDVADNAPQDGGEAGEKLRHQDDENVSPRSGKVAETIKPTAVQQVRRRRGRQPVILSRLIESNVVLPMAKVYYHGKERPFTEGCITRDGIKCNCCDKVFKLTDFELHAGSKNHRPAANIFLEDGRSLMDCQKQMGSKTQNIASKKRSGVTRDSSKRKRRAVESSESSDVCNGDSSKPKRLGVESSSDVCTVCHYGGELMLCDQCSATFHNGCVGLEAIPDGDWFCPACCCGICGDSKFDDSVEDKIGRVCDQCEHTFHIRCLSQGEVKTKETYHSKWFCSDGCEDVFSALRGLLGAPISLGVDDLTWRILKFKKSDHPMETKKKLKKALKVMHESFHPMKDHLTGRDIIEDAIFSRRSELKHLNFKGFYTVVLEKKGEVVSVATLRVYKTIAEMPLVATKVKYRRHGLCRLMLEELEKQLAAAGVARLILPSSPSVLETWTTKFGYSKLTDSERFQLLNYAFLDFEGTILCQKHLLKGLPEESCNTE